MIAKGMIKERFEVVGPGAQLKSFIFIDTRFPGQDRFEQGGAAPATGYQYVLCERIVKELATNDAFSEHISLGEIRVLSGGRSDILLSVYVDHHRFVNHFVTDYLRVQPEVDRTTTTWVCAAST